MAFRKQKALYGPPTSVLGYVKLIMYTPQFYLSISKETPLEIGLRTDTIPNT